MSYEVLGTRTAPTFGLDTFGDVEHGPDGQPVSQAEAIRQVVAEGVLADRVGVDYFGVGSTTAPRWRCPRPTSCWPRSPGRPPASGSAPR
ncbi:hypothetical protein ACFQV2_17235 [Actinokineospora soli]|uniref:Uncharacterized protein n=1 Tax=Actinokineospora soli TaxID=1048753 RepID=A0ABW2TR26_9PSEU